MNCSRIKNFPTAAPPCVLPPIADAGTKSRARLRRLGNKRLGLIRDMDKLAGTRNECPPGGPVSWSGNGQPQGRPGCTGMTALGAMRLKNAGAAVGPAGRK